MNKDELTASLKAKNEAFEKLTEVAKTEKRELNEDEVAQVGVLKAERSDLNAQIEVLDAEVAEREAKELEAKELELKVQEEADADSKRTKDELESVKRDLADANEKLTINKRTNEMNEDKNLIASVREQLNSNTGGTVKSSTRAAVDGDTTAMAEIVPKYVTELDIMTKIPIWKLMGCDVMTGAQGTFNLPYQDPIIGAKLAELASITGDTVSPSGVLIQPRRFSVQKTFTLETINSASDGFLQKVLGDMVLGCDRAITTEIYTKLIAAATEVATGAITKVGFDALQGGAEVENDGAFLSARTTFFEAKAVAIDSGSGRFLVERMGDVTSGKGAAYDGTPYWYSSLFDDQATFKYVIYGDTSKIFVADYGQVEVIVDKFTKAISGHVVITVNKIADTAVMNPAAFVKSPDLLP